MVKKRKTSEDEEDGKGLFSEKECHNLMARACGKSKIETTLKTFISETTKTYRDIFVLTAALGVISNEPPLPLPSDKNRKIRTVNENDIKIEHDNILRAIAYWHRGNKENDKDCHKILIEKNEFRKIGEKYCFAGKTTLEELISSGMFDSDLIKKLLNRNNN